MLNIPFAQYIKGDIDYAKNFVIDNRNSLAFHVGGGIAVPYGNASVVPFENDIFLEELIASVDGLFENWGLVPMLAIETIS